MDSNLDRRNTRYAPTCVPLFSSHFFAVSVPSLCQSLFPSNPSLTVYSGVDFPLEHNTTQHNTAQYPHSVQRMAARAPPLAAVSRPRPPSDASVADGTDHSLSPLHAAVRRTPHRNDTNNRRPQVLLPRELLRWELDALFKVQRWRQRLRVHSALDRLVSSHPLHDFSVVVWIVLGVGLPFVGYPLLWRFVIAFFVCMVGAAVVRARTPGELDPRIAPLGQVSPNGSPVVEVVLAVVVFGSVAAGADVGVAATLAVVFCVLVGLKVYSTTYFLHQLAASAALGGALLWIAFSVERNYFARRMSNGLKLGFGFLGALMFLGFIAYKIENNDAPVGRVSKRECECGASGPCCVVVACLFGCVGHLRVHPCTLIYIGDFLRCRHACAGPHHEQ